MAKDFNSQKVVQQYDEHIRQLIPGYELIHQQVDAILRTSLTGDAHILIVGCGTGYELEYLLKSHPTWRFMALDPSTTMLQKAQAQIAALDQSERVQFVQGEISSVPDLASFDVVLSILVSHFIPYDLKHSFFMEIAARLKAGGLLLSYDLMTCAAPQQLKALACLCQSHGLTLEQSQKMLERIDQDFFSISFETYQQLLHSSGFEQVHRFSQIFSYQGVMAQK